MHKVDQVLLFTSGEGKAIVAGKEQVHPHHKPTTNTQLTPHLYQKIKASDVVIVPAGTQHQFINTSSTSPLEVVTIYSPAEHDPQTVHKTKEEGDEEEDAGKDEAPEWALKSTEFNESTLR